MATFNDIKKLLKIPDSFMIAIIQAMVYSGCFKRFKKNDRQYSSESLAHQAEIAEKFQKNIPKEWADFESELPDDALEIKEILNFDFSMSDWELYEKCIISFTQLNMLGQEYNPFMTSHYSGDKYKKDSKPTLAQRMCMEKSGFVNKREWKETEAEIKWVFLNAGLTPFLEARLDCLFKNLQKYGAKKSKVSIFYSTNPRLIFPYEDYSYIAETLTNMFISYNNLPKSNYKLIYNTIRKVLETSPYHWENHLNRLEKEILDAVRLILKNDSIKWSKIYPLHSEIYDKHAELARSLGDSKRDIPGNSWPTIDHYLPELVAKFSKKYHFHNFEIIIIPVIGYKDEKTGQFRSNNTQTLVKAFVNYVKEKKIEIDHLALVGDVSATASATRQHEEVSRELENLGIRCKIGLLNNGIEDEDCNFDNFMSELAKFLYLKRLDINAIGSSKKKDLVSSAASMSSGLFYKMDSLLDNEDLPLCKMPFRITFP